MTMLPPEPSKKLGLVIDLDICVGCHACAVNCKEWNTSGITGPMEDLKPYGDEPSGVWYNRIHSYEFKKRTKRIEPFTFQNHAYIAMTRLV